MAHHLLGDVDGNVLFPIVNLESSSVTECVGDDMVNNPMRETVPYEGW